jgi:hypothetical protein
MTTKNQPLLDVPQLVQEAHERCQEHLSPAPLEYSLYLSVHRKWVTTKQPAHPAPCNKKYFVL